MDAYLWSGFMLSLHDNRQAEKEGMKSVVVDKQPFYWIYVKTNIFYSLFYYIISIYAYIYIVILL